MDLTLRTEAFTTEDQSWLGSEYGTDTTDSITLDGTLCGALYTDGIVKSGTVLAKVTATGRYAPYDDTLSNGQEVAAGLLYTTVTLLNVRRGDTSGTYHNVGAALMWQGEVITSKLPVPSGAGAIDAAGKVDLKLFRFV